MQWTPRRWADSPLRLALLALLWAGLVRLFERAGWVSGVRWPSSPARAAAERDRARAKPNDPLIMAARPPDAK